MQTTTISSTKFRKFVSAWEKLESILDETGWTITEKEVVVPKKMVTQVKNTLPKLVATFSAFNKTAKKKKKASKKKAKKRTKKA